VARWKVPGEWAAVAQFNETYDLARTEFDRQFYTAERIRAIAAHTWRCSRPLYDTDGDAYVERCSRRLLQLRGRRMLFVGDSTTDRAVKALAYAYEEVYGRNPFDDKIELTVLRTNHTYSLFPLHALNATLLYLNAAFLTHASLEEFRPVSKLWGARLPGAGAPGAANPYTGSIDHVAVFQGECTVCESLDHILRAHSPGAIIANGGAWFNSKKVHRLHALTAYEVAVTAFWRWVAASGSRAIW